jgi:hypothetical protein
MLIVPRYLLLVLLEVLASPEVKEIRIELDKPVAFE